MNIEQSIPILKTKENMKAIKDTIAIRRIKKLFPTKLGIELVADDGNVHVEVPSGLDPRKITAVLENSGWYDQETTDGVQNGCVCVHGADGYFVMLKA